MITTTTTNSNTKHLRNHPSTNIASYDNGAVTGYSTNDAETVVTINSAISSKQFDDDDYEYNNSGYSSTSSSTTASFPSNYSVGDKNSNNHDRNKKNNSNKANTSNNSSNVVDKHKSTMQTNKPKINNLKTLFEVAIQQQNVREKQRSNCNNNQKEDEKTKESQSSLSPSQGPLNKKAKITNYKSTTDEASQQQSATTADDANNNNNDHVLIGFGLDGKPLMAPAGLAKNLLSFLSQPAAQACQEQQQQNRSSNNMEASTSTTVPKSKQQLTTEQQDVKQTAKDNIALFSQITNAGACIKNAARTSSLHFKKRKVRELDTTASATSSPLHSYAAPALDGVMKKKRELSSDDTNQQSLLSATNKRIFAACAATNTTSPPVLSLAPAAATAAAPALSMAPAPASATIPVITKNPLTTTTTSLVVPATTNSAPAAVVREDATTRILHQAIQEVQQQQAQLVQSILSTSSKLGKTATSAPAAAATASTLSLFNDSTALAAAANALLPSKPLLPLLSLEELALRQQQQQQQQQSQQQQQQLQLSSVANFLALTGGKINAATNVVPNPATSVSTSAAATAVAADQQQDQLLQMILQQGTAKQQETANAAINPSIIKSSATLSRLPRQTQQQVLTNNHGPTTTSSRTTSPTSTTPCCSRSIGSTDACCPLLYVPRDEEQLMPFQRMLRKQMQFFEAKIEDVKCNNKGRNKRIVVGQVGIRCLHCSNVSPEDQMQGATYFPAKLDLLYQAAQHMVNKHICGGKCPNIPSAVQDKLCKLKGGKSPNGCGKGYWADSAQELGIRERDGILVFSKNHCK